MKSGLLFFIFIFQFIFVNAQVGRTPVTSVYTRIATYSTINTDVFSFTGNQAALAACKNFSAGVFGERRFALEELGMYSLAVALPTSSGNFGLKADYFGGGEYNETTIGLAYARSLGNKLDIGVQFNYNMFRAGMYGNTSSINFDAGAIFHLTEKLQTGIHVYNPTGSKMRSGEEEKLPTIYNIGFGYDVSERFFFGAEVEKMKDFPLSVNAGVHYKIDKLIARAGITTATSVYYIGLGVLLNDIRIDATASVHPYLGISPGLLLIYSGKR